MSAGASDAIVFLINLHINTAVYIPFSKDVWAEVGVYSVRLKCQSSAGELVSEWECSFHFFDVAKRVMPSIITFLSLHWAFMPLSRDPGMTPTVMMKDKQGHLAMSSHV